MKKHFIYDTGDHCHYALCGYVETKFSCSPSFTKFESKVTCKKCKQSLKKQK